MKTIAKIKTIGMVLLILTAMMTVFVSQVSAKPEYLTSLQSAYGKGSCADCHTDPSGGKSLTTYGSEFKSQSNYKSAPSAAILAIGQPGGAPVVTNTVVVTPSATPTLTSTPKVTTTTVSTPNETTAVVATSAVVSTPVVAETTSNSDKTNKELGEKEEEKNEKEETKGSPGLGIVITIGIVSMVYILRRYKF